MDGDVLAALLTGVGSLIGAFAGLIPLLRDKDDDDNEDTVAEVAKMVAIFKAMENSRGPADPPPA